MKPEEDIYPCGPQEHAHYNILTYFTSVSLLAGTITVGDKEVVTVFALDGLAVG